MQSAGAEVVQIVDLRPDSPASQDSWQSRLRAAGISVETGARVLGTRGFEHLTAVEIGRVDAGTRADGFEPRAVFPPELHALCDAGLADETGGGERPGGRVLHRAVDFFEGGRRFLDGRGLAFAVGSANGMTQSQAGQNATATINGVSISSASNRLADTLPGMTIQLSQVTTTPVEIDVSADTEAVRANVQAFVDAYNTLNSTLSNATRYDAGTKKAGALQGDSTATGLQNALRGMMRSVTGGTPYTRLADVGIELKTGGALALDAEKFDASLSNLEGLKSLFTVDTGSATTEGFGRKIKTFAEGLIDADGLVSTKASALQKSIDRNGLEQERVNDRAARAETRYLAQYNAMDAAVAKMNSLNAYVAQQITLWNRNSG